MTNLNFYKSLLILIASNHSLYSRAGKHRLNCDPSEGKCKIESFAKKSEASVNALKCVNSIYAMYASIASSAEKATSAMNVNGTLNAVKAYKAKKSHYSVGTGVATYAWHARKARYAIRVVPSTVRILSYFRGGCQGMI